ncbi:hypothetical protein U1E44_02345 [Arenibacter sp. GZD96]|uniref:hypothetical protein n=1 Tax=Aurantibrevibacter litoralis TaxID=3106030 RepID=UPI002AFFB05C|nr:hypothetical protein [Arenibacter sp. GZD-96]MEA1784919.1 hypothetical protein [Arenibacter sp. GZD-96]
METQDVIKKNKKTIQLVDGTFTPSEANDVIMALIDEKINFHKIQRLQIWEGNHQSETNGLDNRIQELEKEKRTARSIFNEARGQGAKILINGTLEINFLD